MTAPVIYHVTGKGKATFPSLPGIGFGGLIDVSSKQILSAAMEALGVDGTMEAWRSVVRLVARAIWVYGGVPLGSVSDADLKETMRDLVADGDGPWDSDDELFAVTTRILKAHYEANKGKEEAKMAEGEKLWDIMTGLPEGVRGGAYSRLDGTHNTVPGFRPTIKNDTWYQIIYAMRAKYGISSSYGYYMRMNAAIMRARLRGFNWRNYKNATEADHLAAIKEEWDAIGDNPDEVQIRLNNAVIDLMKKFGIGPYAQTNNNTKEEAPVNQTTNKTQTSSTGEMLKRNIKQAGVNTAIIKVNQGLTEIMVRNLKDKIPQIDTAEGRSILQTLTPVLLHFAATSFPEHVPKAESVTGYVDKAAELALTTGGVMLADKAQEMLTPIAMEMFNHIQESVAAMPKVIRDELTTGPTQEEKEMKAKQQAAMAQEKTL